MARIYRTIPALSPKDIARFWSKIEIKRPDECWLWISTVRQEGVRGYGAFHLYRHSGYFTAHRIAYVIQNGPIANDLMVCHSCDVKLCCNGNHLFSGTNSDNMLDASRKGRIASGDRNGARLYPERMPRGEDQGTAKLTEENVREIRRTYFPYKMSSPKLAKQFGVDHKTILNIIHDKIWRHVS